MTITRIKNQVFHKRYQEFQKRFPQQPLFPHQRWQLDETTFMTGEEYPRFTSIRPKIQERATEYIYVMTGQMKVKDIQLQRDFLLLPQQGLKITPHAFFMQKFAPHTRIIRIDIPSIEPTRVYSPLPELSQWLTQW